MLESEVKDCSLSIEVICGGHSKSPRGFRLLLKHSSSLTFLYNPYPSIRGCGKFNAPHIGARTLLEGLPCPEIISRSFLRRQHNTEHKAKHNQTHKYLASIYREIIIHYRKSHGRAGNRTRDLLSRTESICWIFFAKITTTNH